ncbi:MAG TPA: hypothetical protein VFW16_13185 [Streptosporangiaceae bacterium]|nr:hypothetical protein [Streptosporangiaceae bacterium]
MSEHEESAGSDPTIPGQPPGQHEPDPPGKAGTRGQAAARVVGAVTSRTAGWMVAAALAGSLVTLLADGGTSQPAGQIAVRNVSGTTTPAGGRASWRMQLAPVTPRRAYIAPGGPLAGGMLAPACAFPGPRTPPAMFRHPRSVTIYGRQRVAIGKKGGRLSWTVIGRGRAWQKVAIIGPGCQVIPPRCWTAIGVRNGKAPAFKQIIIKRHGRVVIIGPGGRAQRRVSIDAKAGQWVQVVAPAARPAWQALRDCVPVSHSPGR